MSRLARRPHGRPPGHRHLAVRTAASPHRPHVREPGVPRAFVRGNADRGEPRGLRSPSARRGSRLGARVTSAWREGDHFYRHARVEQSAAIVDARSYYRAFYRAALGAERYLFVAGWQFDSEVALLRGPDAEGAPLPLKFLPF